MWQVSGLEWWMMFLGMMVMLLFWGGVIVLAFFAIRAMTRTGHSGHDRPPTSPRGETPLEILKGRYARGELAREEYLAMRRDLEG